MQGLPKTYREFWLFYLGEHRNPTNLHLHFIGTSISFLLLVRLVFVHDWRIFAAAVFAGYFCAWVGHFFFEKNRPASFKYPLWSFVSDWRLWFLLLIRSKPHSAVR